MNQEVHHYFPLKRHVDYLQALQVFTAALIPQPLVLRTLLLPLPRFSFRVQHSRCLTKITTGWFLRSAFFNERNNCRCRHRNRTSFRRMSEMNSNVHISFFDVVRSIFLDIRIVSGVAPWMCQFWPLSAIFYNNSRLMWIRFGIWGNVLVLKIIIVFRKNF